VDDQDASARGRKKLDGTPYMARLTQIGTVYLMHSKCVAYLQIKSNQINLLANCAKK